MFRCLHCLRFTICFTLTTKGKRCSKSRSRTHSFQIRDSNPSDADIYILCGYPPKLIQKIAGKALDFWQNQIDFKCKVIKSKFIKTQRDKNELSQHIESEKLRFEQEMEEQVKNYKKMEAYSLKLKSAGMKYKVSYNKIRSNYNKLQNDKNERDRQFENIKTKYTDLLRKNKRRRSHSPSSIGSVPSFHSPQSVHSRKRQKPNDILHNNASFNITEFQPQRQQKRRLSQPPMPINRHQRRTKEPRRRRSFSSSFPSAPV